jgi:hypothetical protein
MLKDAEQLAKMPNPDLPVIHIDLRASGVMMRPKNFCENGRSHVGPWDAKGIALGISTGGGIPEVRKGTANFELPFQRKAEEAARLELGGTNCGKSAKPKSLSIVPVTGRRSRNYYCYYYINFFRQPEITWAWQ